jgi:ribosomal protein S18 acetylase RimI-like enzyme
MADLMIRPALEEDLEILWDFLAIAAYEPDAAAVKTLPNVAAYLAGWRRPGDFGFVAEQDGTVIGAAWGRQFSADDRKIAFADDRTPWISIGVRPAARGQGIGEKLLRALIAEAGLRRLGLCLSVRNENPARRIYERLGFRVVAGSAVPNRAGGVSLGMFRPADDAAHGVMGVVEDQPQ